MHMHIQEISQASSIAEHDLSDLVVSDGPSTTSFARQAGRFGGEGGRAARAGRIDASYQQPVSSPPPGEITQPPRAILYASPSASAAGHATSSSFEGGVSEHPVSLIPTVSPPRYQLSLSHPGSPPSRASASASAYHPAAASPSLSLTSAPTVLQSFPSWSQTWQSGGVSMDGRGFTNRVGEHSSHHNYQQQQHVNAAHRAVSNPDWLYGNPAHAQERERERPSPYPTGWLPEYDDAVDSEGITPLTAEQQARITGEQYRLGVGYDAGAGSGGSGGSGHASGGGTGGKLISEERRRERLRALEREFGRVKGSMSLSPTGDEATSATVAAGGGLASKFNKKNSGPAKYTSGEEKSSRGHGGLGEGGSSPDETDPEKMTFKQLRAKQKAERKRIDSELGVTKSGNLVTQGPGRRKALRWTEALLGLVAVISGIGGAFFTHPKKDESPAPSGAVSTWFLYLISVASLVCSAYLFAVKPCMRRSKSKSSAETSGTMATLGGTAAGGLVLPIFTSSSHDYNALGGGKKQKKKKGWGKNKHGIHHGQQPMTVNLVVDPSMLGLGAGAKPPSRYDDSGFDEAEEEEALQRQEAAYLNAAEDDHDHDHDHDFHIPDSSRLEAKRREQLRGGGGAGGAIGGMLDTMSAMRLQDRWREARRRMKWMAWIDAAWATVWYAESLFAIGFGKSCKPGSASGWCDTYNLALASGVLLAVCFTTSSVFDFIDLRRSRSVPRISRGMTFGV